ASRLRPSDWDQPVSLGKTDKMGEPAEVSRDIRERTLRTSRDPGQRLQLRKSAVDGVSEPPHLLDQRINYEPNEVVSRQEVVRDNELTPEVYILEPAMASKRNLAPGEFEKRTRLLF